MRGQHQLRVTNASHSHGPEHQAHMTAEEKERIKAAIAHVPSDLSQSKYAEQLRVGLNAKRGRGAKGVLAASSKEMMRCNRGGRSE